MDNAAIRLEYLSSIKVFRKILPEQEGV